ncbi:hypothetical protein E5288_WYG011034 [Bos mutus]|uniref:Uncharacterized protein n=1 Tax=Bos mutus TaxID=72004 RepID=A0A6B0R3I9_9CETA|nr:hypothetical protein [Bos mutus]
MQLQPPGLAAPQDSMQSGPPAQSGAEGDYPGLPESKLPRTGAEMKGRGRIINIKEEKRGKVIPETFEHYEQENINEKKPGVFGKQQKIWLECGVGMIVESLDKNVAMD